MYNRKRRKKKSGNQQPNVLKAAAFLLSYVYGSYVLNDIAVHKFLSSVQKVCDWRMLMVNNTNEAAILLLIITTTTKTPTTEKEASTRAREKNTSRSKIEQWLSVRAIYADTALKRLLFYVSRYRCCCSLTVFFSSSSFISQMHVVLCVAISLAHRCLRTWNDCVEQHRFTRCYRKLIVENCLLSHLLLVRRFYGVRGAT